MKWETLCYILIWIHLIMRTEKKRMRKRNWSCNMLQFAKNYYYFFPSFSVCSVLYIYIHWRKGSLKLLGFNYRNTWFSIEYLQVVSETWNICLKATFMPQERLPHTYILIGLSAIFWEKISCKFSPCHITHQRNQNFN